MYSVGKWICRRRYSMKSHTRQTQTTNRGRSQFQHPSHSLSPRHFSHCSVQGSDCVTFPPDSISRLLSALQSNNTGVSWNPSRKSTLSLKSSLHRWINGSHVCNTWWYPLPQCFKSWWVQPATISAVDRSILDPIFFLHGLPKGRSRLQTRK